MNELDKAYETAEMLKALDLPLSKEQLENIERLERENGKDHREDLKYYFFEKCFANYTKRILNIRQAKKYGEVIVAKPVLLLAIIDGIERGVFTSNAILLNDWLEARYEVLMRQYTRHSQFEGFSPINNPFWHLESDGFWHLHYSGAPQTKTKTPSTKWLKETVRFASFDDDLWILLQNEVMRQRLRDYIVEHKLSDGGSGLQMVAEAFGVMTGLLLAVA